jgi:hypothetical protein
VELKGVRANLEEQVRIKEGTLSIRKYATRQDISGWETKKNGGVKITLWKVMETLSTSWNTYLGRDAPRPE